MIQFMPLRASETPEVPEKGDIKGATLALTTIRHDARAVWPFLLGPINDKWQPRSLRAVKKKTNRSKKK